MSESSIVFSLVDRFTAPFRSITNANQGFNKSTEETKRMLSQLNGNLRMAREDIAKYKAEMQEAKKVLKQAEENHAKFNNTISSSELDAAHQKYDKLKDDIERLNKNVKDTRTSIKQLNDESARSPSGSKGSGTAERLLSEAGRRGVMQMSMETGSNFFSYALGSTFGEKTANYVGSTISGAARGAAFGPAGIVVGAITGLANAHIEEKKEEEEYYKQAVQDTYNAIHEERDRRITSGTAVAAGREVDELAFNKLLGDGVGTQYLADLRDLAAHTPMEYDQLTEISRQLAIGFGDESDRMLELIEVVGDAGSAVGLDASGMVTIATALSRMQSSDKVTLEYLNLIQERGIDAIGIIGSAMNLTTAQVYDAISAGTLDGSDIVDILQEGMAGRYGGSMEEQSQTTSGLSSTLQDQQTERESLTGEQYNSIRNGGMLSEISFNDSEVGQAVMETDALIGGATAAAESLKNNYINQALEFLHTGDGLGKNWSDDLAGQMLEKHQAYQRKEAEWESEQDPVQKSLLGLELAQLQEEARIVAESAYEQSDFYRRLHEIDMELVGGIQAAEREGYFTVGKEISDELSQGLVDGARENRERIKNAFIDAVTGSSSSNGAHRSHAYGLDRVPYDGYRAVLHEGERVLTASQARQADRGSTSGMVVDIHDCSFAVRDEGDVDLIAAAIVEKIVSAQGVYAG